MTDIENKSGEADSIMEEVDIEVWALKDKEVPLARSYRFKVNETVCKWKSPIILGREILEQAGLVPPELYSLREKIRGGVPRRIELDEKVNLRKPGVEKFRAIRRGQTEGECYE